MFTVSTNAPSKRQSFTGTHAEILWFIESLPHGWQVEIKHDDREFWYGVLGDTTLPTTDELIAVSGETRTRRTPRDMLTIAQNNRGGLDTSMYWLVECLKSRLVFDHGFGMDVAECHHLYFHWLAEQWGLYDDDGMAPTWLSAVVSQVLNEFVESLDY